MPVTLTSIRLDTKLADEAVRVLGVKSRTEAVHRYIGFNRPAPYEPSRVAHRESGSAGEELFGRDRRATQGSR